MPRPINQKLNDLYIGLDKAPLVPAAKLKSKAKGSGHETTVAIKLLETLVMTLETNANLIKNPQKIQQQFNSVHDFLLAQISARKSGVIPTERSQKSLNKLIKKLNIIQEAFQTKIPRILGAKSEEKPLSATSTTFDPKTKRLIVTSADKTLEAVREEGNVVRITKRENDTPKLQTLRQIQYRYKQGLSDLPSRGGKLVIDGETIELENIEENKAKLSNEDYHHLIEEQENLIRTKISVQLAKIPKEDKEALIHELYGRLEISKTDTIIQEELDVLATLYGLEENYLNNEDVTINEIIFRRILSFSSATTLATCQQEFAPIFSVKHDPRMIPNISIVQMEEGLRPVIDINVENIPAVEGMDPNTPPQHMATLKVFCDPIKATTEGSCTIKPNSV